MEIKAEVNNITAILASIHKMHVAKRRNIKLRLFMMLPI